MKRLKKLTKKTKIRKKYFAFLAIIQIFPVFALPVMTDQMREEAYAASVIGANLCYLKKGRLDERTFVLNVEKVIKDKGYSLEVLNKDEVQEVGKLVAKKLGNDCTNDKVFQNEDFLFEMFEIFNWNI